MDASLHSEERHIRNLIEDIVDVGHIGDIRARLVGRNLLVDMDIFLPPNSVLGKGLETVGKIKNTLHRKRKDISEVSVQQFALPVTDEPVHKTDY